PCGGSEGPARTPRPPLGTALALRYRDTHDVKSITFGAPAHPRTLHHPSAAPTPGSLRPGEEENHDIRYHRGNACDEAGRTAHDPDAHPGGGARQLRRVRRLRR